MLLASNIHVQQALCVLLFFFLLVLPFGEKKNFIKRFTIVTNIIVLSNLYSTLTNTQISGVVYLITCEHCYKLYIGETGRRLADRFGEHPLSVESFKQNPCYQRGGFPVAEHFNLPEHNQAHDMRVSVVRQVKEGTAPPLREERRLILAGYTTPQWLEH